MQGRLALVYEKAPTSERIRSPVEVGACGLLIDPRRRCLPRFAAGQGPSRTRKNLPPADSGRRVSPDGGHGPASPVLAHGEQSGQTFSDLLLSFWAGAERGFGDFVIMGLLLRHVGPPPRGSPNLQVIVNPQEHHFLLQFGQLGKLRAGCGCGLARPMSACCAGHRTAA